jgi:hypothetical protein
METIKVIAHKTCTTEFTVMDGSRLEIERGVSHKLLSYKELVWVDSPEGINVVCIRGTAIWRPRRRFFSTDDGSLLIEDKSVARPNGGGE